MDENLILEFFCCPACKSDLQRGVPGEGRTYKHLVCNPCRLAFRIEDGIPILLIEQAENLDQEKQAVAETANVESVADSADQDDVTKTEQVESNTGENPDPLTDNPAAEAMESEKPEAQADVQSAEAAADSDPSSSTIQDAESDANSAPNGEGTDESTESRHTN